MTVFSANTADCRIILMLRLKSSMLMQVQAESGMIESDKTQVPDHGIKRTVGVFFRQL